MPIAPGTPAARVIDRVHRFPANGRKNAAPALCAGLAVKSGMDHDAALRAITINHAHHVGIADRGGSVEAGKDGDVVVAGVDSLVSSTEILAVFVDGKKVG